MPTNYVGAKANTQAPSAKPEPEGSITAALPADGDPPNASTYIQAYKVCADFIDFLMKLQAKASAWAAWIWATRSSGGHKRFLVDHLGFPMGRIQSWREGWERGGTPAISGNMSTPVSLVGNPVKFTTQIVADFYNAGVALSNAGAAADFAAAKTYLSSAGTNLQDINTAMVELTRGDRWNVYTKQTTGTSSVEIIAPDSVSSQRFRYATLKAGNTAEDFASLFSEPEVAFSEDVSFAVEWEVKLEAANLSTLTAFLGLSLAGGDPPLKTSSPPTHFAGFRLIPGGGNWFAAHNGGASPTTVDTTVAASTSITRMRIEFHGATVADDTTRAIRLYINGALVNTLTTNLPASSERASIQFSLRNSAGGTSGLSNPLSIGPVRFGSSLYPSDVA